MHRECADREIDAPKAQRRQTDDEAEQGPGQRGRRQHHYKGGADMHGQDDRRERAHCQERRVAERDLPAIAREQHQAERSDRR
jgi:hypothetical protein